MRVVVGVHRVPISDSTSDDIDVAKAPMEIFLIERNKNMLFGIQIVTNFIFLDSSVKLALLRLTCSSSSTCQSFFNP